MPNKLELFIGRIYWELEVIKRFGIFVWLFPKVILGKESGPNYDLKLGGDTGSHLP